MRISKIYIVLCAGLSLTACKKGYMDLSNNPNQVAVPTFASLLSTTTHKTGINSYNAAGLTNPYVQYTASPSPGSTADIYQEVDGSGTWNALYLAMADLYDLKTLATTNYNPDYLGVSNVMLAYHLNQVIDIWGDAPFSEAFNRTTLTPAYDKQEDLYKVAMDMLDSAIVQLRRTDAVIKLAATNDLIYGGAGVQEKTRWLRFAYAMKARMLIKVSKQPSYNAAAVLSAVDSAFKNSTEDAGMKSFQLRNPWATVSRLNAGLTLGGWLSEQFVDHLSGKTYGIFDPRIRKITEPTVTGTWVGTENGSGNKGPANNTVKDEVYISFTAGPWTADTSSLWITTYSEMKFIEAEAALATDPARAYTAYLAGITSNMDKLQVPAADAERIAYMAAASVGAASLTKDLIMKEKYVAMYLNPEAWNDARRYDYKYKNFTLPANAALPAFIRRMPYPTDERSRNGKNIPGAPALTDKIFWDK